MVMRVSGLVSGMQTEEIIKDLMKIEQARVDRHYQQRQLLEWKRDDFRDVNTRLLALKNSLLDLKLESTFTGKSVASSNSAIVTATATSKAIPGSYQVKVNHLATRATLNSSTALGSTEDKTSLAKQFGIDPTTVINFAISGKDGKQVRFSNQAQYLSMEKIITDINKADIGIRAYYDAGVDRVFLSSTAYGNDGQINIEMDSLVAPGQSFAKDILKLGVDYSAPNSGSDRVITSDALYVLNPAAPAGSTPPLASGTTTLAELYPPGGAPGQVNFTLEGNGGSQDFTFSSTDSIDTVIATINGGTTGITAAFDSATGRMTLTSPESAPGSGVALLAIRADGQLFLESKLNLAMSTTSGQRASIDFEGSTGLEFDSNQFTLNDIQFNLLGTSPETVTLTVDNNTDAALEKIKDFIEKYNTAVEYLNTELSETRYRGNKSAENFPPLTEEQKKDMSEDEIKKWEEKARSGMLRSDPLIRSLVSETRSEASGILMNRVSADRIKDPADLVDGLSYKSLAAIGITTATYIPNSTENGKLMIADEEKLRAALRDDPDSVMKLFTLTQEEDREVKVTYWEDGREVTRMETRTLVFSVGIAQRLYDAVSDGMNRITDEAGMTTSAYDNSALGKQIGRVNERISDLLENMKMVEERYWRKFTAMEKALQQITMQGNWLMQKIGEMGGGQQQ